MTINTTTRLAGPYTGNGVQTVFAYAFKIFLTSDLVVTRADTAGVETVLTLGVDYTATMNADQDAAPGGNVTLSAALTNLYKLTITSEVPQLQSTVTTNGGGFYPSVFNGVFDRLTIFAQQLAEKLNRSIKLPKTSGLTGSELAVLANAVVRWKADGSGVYSQDFASFCADAGIAVNPATYATAVAAAQATSLQKASNLSDVGSAATSRGNLGFVAGLNALWTAIDAAAARAALSLTTAATTAMGTGANQIVQLNGSSQLPAVDGSLLTGISGLSFTRVGKSASFTHTSAQNKAVYEFTGALGTGVVLTVAPATVADTGWFGVDNQGTGPFLITTSAGTIDGKASIYVYPGERFLIRSDGTNLRTLGRLKRVLVKSTTIAGSPTTVDFEDFSGDTEAVRLAFEVIDLVCTNGAALRFKKSGAYLTSGYGGQATYVDGGPNVNINGAQTAYIALGYSGSANNNGRFALRDLLTGQSARAEGRLDAGGVNSICAVGFGGTNSTTATALQGVRFMDASGAAITNGGVIACFVERE